MKTAGVTTGLTIAGGASVMLIGLVCMYRRHSKASKIKQQLKNDVVGAESGTLDANVTRKRNGRIVVDGDAATEDNMSTPRDERDREVDELLTPRSKSMLNAQSSTPQPSDLRASLLQKQEDDKRVRRLTRTKSRCIRADLERLTNSSDGSGKSQPGSGRGGAGVGVDLQLNADEVRESRAAFLKQQEDIDNQMSTGQITSRPFSDCSDLLDEDEYQSKKNGDSDGSDSEPAPTERDRYGAGRVEDIYLGDMQDDDQNDDDTQSDHEDIPIDPSTVTQSKRKPRPCSSFAVAPSANSSTHSYAVNACPAPSRLPRPSAETVRNTLRAPSTIVEEDDENGSNVSSSRSSNGSGNPLRQPLMVDKGQPRTAQHI